MQRTYLPRPQSIGEKDEILMYIVAIGWVYVALMMAITEHNVVAGIATFLMYGLAPVALVLYIMGTPGRRRRKAEAEAAAERTQQAAGEARTGKDE
jgi:membrane protein implicated in regulation of membrane protease activity